MLTNTKDIPQKKNNIKSLQWNFSIRVFGWAELHPNLKSMAGYNQKLDNFFLPLKPP